MRLLSLTQTLALPLRMSDRTNWPIQRRLLLGALLSATLLIVGYLVVVSTPWGHQLDDDAYFGRTALSRKVIVLDSKLLDHVGKAVLMRIFG